MKHLIICREYPPAPSGGIGTYVLHISRLLTECGDTVHVIGQLWEGAEKRLEEKCDGRLIIHRVPLQDWTSIIGQKPSTAIRSKEARALFDSSFYPQSFSWQASLLAEKLVEQEGIDLIEAQEFEAPLYFLQLRRALGMGPQRQPPIIIHLHSPMEFIVRHNDWDIGHPYFLTAKRLENYSITAADALLCPSRYLARQAETHYGIAKGSIKVIPLPIGDSPLLERDKDTWEHGTICYIGRLERRKGVIEWVDAAVTVACEDPTVRFEFVGANILSDERMSGEELIERRIPEDMRVRFLFRGQQKRSSLPQFLSRARIGVVPSRWENFPNTCIEAMCSGLPVIASPNGGMAEMIKDSYSGWLAENASSEALAAALRRALGTPVEKLAEMGRRASLDIRQMCDNQKIVQSHLDFRSQLVNQGAKRSLCLPVNLPWAKKSLYDAVTHRLAKSNSGDGVAIVVNCFESGHSLNGCLRNLKRQTRKPAAVVIVDNGSTEKHTLKALNQARREGWQVIQKRNEGDASAKNIGVESVLDSGVQPLGFAFLDPEERLRPYFVDRCESVLKHCPEVGLVSCWTTGLGGDDKPWMKPCPGFPYQWLANEMAPFSIIRTEALRQAGGFRLIMSQGYENWDLFNAVLAAGWFAVTIPEILGEQSIEGSPMPRINSSSGRMRRELLERFPELIARDATEIAILSTSDNIWSTQAELYRLQEQFAAVRNSLRYPQQSALHVLRKVKAKLLRRTAVWMPALISRGTS